MQGDQLVEGRFYAYRERPLADGYLMNKVKLLEKVGRKGKIKIRFEDGPHPPYIDDEEEELRLRGNEPGDRFFHRHLRELSPGFALARQWAGLDQEAEALRKEIARLRSLLSRAAYDLKSAGKDGEARRLLRAIEGR